MRVDAVLLVPPAILGIWTPRATATEGRRLSHNRFEVMDVTSKFQSEQARRHKDASWICTPCEWTVPDGSWPTETWHQLSKFSAWQRRETKDYKTSSIMRRATSGMKYGFCPFFFSRSLFMWSERFKSKLAKNEEFGGKWKGRSSLLCFSLLSREILVNTAQGRLHRNLHERNQSGWSSGIFRLTEIESMPWHTNAKSPLTRIKNVGPRYATSPQPFYGFHLERKKRNENVTLTRGDSTAGRAHRPANKSRCETSPF